MVFFLILSPQQGYFLYLGQAGRPVSQLILAHQFTITMNRKLHILSFLCLLILGSYQSQAQLSDGSIAPDFTATDINGNTYHLYDYLDQEKPWW